MFARLMNDLMGMLISSVFSCAGPIYVVTLANISRGISILKRKRNETLSKTVVSSFSSKNSASDNVIAKYRYLPCIQQQNQTAVTYGWRAATRNVRQPPFLKSQSSKIVPFLRKNILNQYRIFESKSVDKIESGTFKFLSTSILSK